MTNLHLKQRPRSMRSIATRLAFTILPMFALGCATVPAPAAAVSEAPAAQPEQQTEAEAAGPAVASAATPTAHNGLPTLSMAEVTLLVEQGHPGLTIFDANPRELYEKHHLPGARWIAYNDVKASDLPEDLTAALLFYCANPKCMASTYAARAAVKLGHDNVRVMPDGIFGWLKAELPVEPR